MRSRVNGRCPSAQWREAGPRLNIKTVLSTYGDFHRPLGRLIFNMGIAIPGKTVFLIETAPEVRLLPCRRHCLHQCPPICWHNMSIWRHYDSGGLEANCYKNQCVTIISYQEIDWIPGSWVHDDVIKRKHFPWINGWVNNREASDLRRYLAHYDVTVVGRQDY